MPTPPPLRRYQLEPFAAILRAAEAHQADILTVRMSRQAGKNELSSRVEGVLLGHELQMGTSGQGVKAAPTQTPQAVRSRDRLARHLRACGFKRPALLAGGDFVRLGPASWWFGSGEPNANVVGGTASLLLEFDEAQDFDQEKHDKDYQPMAASTAAATVYYGTAWSDFDLLELQRQAALALEARDGRKRVFDVRWERVAEEVPAYGLFVERERARLGHTEATPHLVFRTQYELIPIAGTGRLFTPAQLALLQGDHDRQDGPLSESHATYVAGLDVGGADLSGSGDPDETVLTIARARFPGRGLTDDADIAVVAQYAWQGLDHDAARGEVLRLLRLWRVAHVAVDATGIGEPMATHLLGALGERKVSAVKFTASVKSSLGYDMLAAVNTGRLRVWRPDGPDHRALMTQARACRRELKAGRLAWYVDSSEGHDDRVTSLGLAVRAAQRGKPRVARQETFAR